MNKFLTLNLLERGEVIEGKCKKKQMLLEKKMK